MAFNSKRGTAHAHSTNLRVLNLVEAGLFGIEGASQAIKAISQRKTLNSIAITHNDLGDDGCTHLFNYLCTPEGRRYHISEINIARNKIGDRGLAAIAAYLKGNTTLRKLYMQSNVYGGDPDITASFAHAISSSKLQALAISTTIQRHGDSLITHLMNDLKALSLMELSIPMTGITCASTPSIQSFLSDSTRCQLLSLQLSGNKLGLRGVREIVTTIETYNWTIARLDLFANMIHGNDAVETDEEYGMEEQERLQMWGTLGAKAQYIVVRNATAKRQTEQEATALLRHSRVVLLHSESESTPSDSPGSLRETRVKEDSIPTLPMELRLHILSFIAPSLSSAQRIRVFKYASNPATLPKLLPTLSSSGNCLPSPSSLPFGPSSTSHGGCASGTCMGTGSSVNCRRESERARWLAEVRCNAYDPDG